MEQDNFLFFFESEEGVHFVESNRIPSWMEYFGEENFIGAVRATKLETCYDVVELFLNFLGHYVHHAEKTRVIKGDVEDIKSFLHSKLRNIITFYNQESLEDWKEASRNNRITEGIKT